MSTRSAAEFVTSDTFLVAYLMTIGHEPACIEGPPERRRFVFVGVPPEDISHYHRSTKLLAPVALFANFKRAKRMLYR
jgi:hypothetical protein